MVALGVFRTGRVVIGAAIAAVVMSTLASSSAHAAEPTLSSMYGPHCTKVAGSPAADETTWKDSTQPTLTSVAWAHKTVTAKPKSSVRITVKLTDDCSGAGDVVLELKNAVTHKTAFFGANYVSSTITSTAIHDTWVVDVPLYGSDAGSISVVHVDVLTGFTSLVFKTTAHPTAADIVYMLPDASMVTPSDYRNDKPPHAAKVVVKAGTTLGTDATPEPAKHGHSITVKASFKKLKTSTYVGVGAQSVTLQYKVPGSSAWHTLKKVKTSSGGFATATYRPAKRGTYSFRAVYAGSTYVASATSAADAVKVS